jgi:hypothetical protein
MMDTKTQVNTNLGCSKAQIRSCSRMKIMIGAGATILCASALLLLPEQAYATPFDLDKAGTSVFDPVLKLVTDHYGKAVVAVGGAGAIIAPGDLRTKAIGFGMGAGLAGLAMLAVKTGFGI